MKKEKKTIKMFFLDKKHFFSRYIKENTCVGQTNIDAVDIN